jgi:hypothetical protein
MRSIAMTAATRDSFSQFEYDGWQRVADKYETAWSGLTFGQQGFDPASLVFRTVVAEWRVPSAAFVFEAERDAGVRMAAILAAQKPEIQKAIQAQIETELQPFVTGNDVTIPCAAHVIAVRTFA